MACRTGSTEARLDEVAPIAAAMVAATRILAYTIPSTARVLADIVPLALVVLLLTGVVGEPGGPAGAARFEVSVSVDAVILGLVALELVLRHSPDGSVHDADSTRRGSARRWISVRAATYRGCCPPR